MNNRRRLLAPLLALGGVLALHLARIYSMRGKPSDDAWITFRYARNWLDGHGLVWNPGLEPVEGYSNLLWLLWSALGLALGAPIEPWVAITGAVLSSLTLLLVPTAVRMLGGSWPAAVGAALLVAVSPPTAHWATQALETPLFTLLLTAAMVLALLEHQQATDGGQEPWALSVLPMSLVAITRPEGVAFLALPVVLRLYRRSRPTWRDAVAAVVLAGPWVAQVVHRVLFYDALLPNTFQAKVSVENAFREGLRYVLAGLTYDPFLGVLWVGGAWLAYKQGRALLLLAPALAVAIAMGVGGDVFGNQRFLVPAIPLLTATAIAAWDHTRGRPRWLATALLIAAVPLELLVDDVRPAQVGSFRLNHLRIRPVERILHHDAWETDVYGSWMVQLLVETVPPGGAFLFSDVGIIGYAMRDATVLDARGLSWPAALDIIDEEAPAGPEGMQTGRVAAFLGQLDAVRPEVLFLQCADGKVFGPPEAVIAAHPTFQEDYFFFGSGPYFSGIGDTCVYVHKQTRLPSHTTILERYARIQAEMPGVFDNRTRIWRLQRGPDRPQVPERDDVPKLPEPGVFDPNFRKAPKRMVSDSDGRGAPSGR